MTSDMTKPTTEGMTRTDTPRFWDGATRGRTQIGWLDGRHSFSFGRHMDPDRMGFRSLRVINDDVIKAGRGFGMHPHEEMEILTWVLDGKIKHEDSTGMSGEITPGDLQLMSAGTGIRHSEFNGLEDAPTRLLQIWIEPSKSGVEPGYQQRSFDAAGRADRWQLLASPDAGDGSLKIHADANVFVSDLGGEARIEARIEVDRFGYLHVARGSVRVGDQTLVEGDAISFEGDGVEVVGIEDSELLFFDLA
ncbi:MAG: pirin family protein [Phycisphaerales bacterium]|nr:pirin family protein [Phycisphaerales bacterium]